MGAPLNLNQYGTENLQSLKQGISVLKTMLKRKAFQKCKQTIQIVFHLQRYQIRLKAIQLSYKI